VKRDLLDAALEESIVEASGEPFVLLARAPVGGGCIHTALRLEGRVRESARTYFAKVNEADKAALFAAEDDGLAALRATGTVRVPATVARGSDGEHAWLVLEWLELASLDARAAAGLGAAQRLVGRLDRVLAGASPVPAASPRRRESLSLAHDRSRRAPHRGLRRVLRGVPAEPIAAAWRSVVGKCGGLARWHPGGV
jgi:hypothetical protein